MVLLKFYCVVFYYIVLVIAKQTNTKYAAELQTCSFLKSVINVKTSVLFNKNVSQQFS